MPKPPNIINLPYRATQLKLSKLDPLNLAIRLSDFLESIVVLYPLLNNNYIYNYPYF